MHRTPDNETVDNTTAVLASTAAGRAGHGLHHGQCGLAAAHTTAIPQTHNPITNTQPLNQQCCDSEHGEGWDNTRESITTQGAGPNPNTRHHTTHTPPAIQQERGHHHTHGRGSTSQPHHSSPCHPTHHATPPSTIATPSTTTMGVADRGYPTTRTPQTDTHHTHRTPGEEQCTTRQQYSLALQWDKGVRGAPLH